MKHAIVNKPHGRPGARLIPISEAFDDLKTVSRIFRRPLKEMESVFRKSGFNTFNPTWTEYIKSVHSTNK